MTRHVDDDRLQDFREGLLSLGESEEIRAHLAECSRCREEMEALGELLDGLDGLPEEAQPSRDLWPQIAWRIGAREGLEEAEMGAAVPPAPGGQREAAARGWRVTLPAWQLLAASLAVAIVSGGVVWVLLSGGTSAPAPMAQTPAEWVQPVAWEDAYRGYSDAVADLEAVLEQGREVLDPETVRVLEESLAVIDRAIAESREALTRDPASTVVRRLLGDNLRRKVELLRHAAAVVYANT